MPFHNIRCNKGWWTRDRVLTALAQAMKEIQCPLPCADSDWNRIKKGRMDWPTSRKVLEYYGSIARAWLSAGAPREWVTLRNLDWLPHEDAYLIQHAGIKTLAVIAKDLRRSYQSVRGRLSRNIGITARANQGFFSAAELAKEYQCPYYRVRMALRKGQIKGCFDKVRNSWQVDLKDLTPKAKDILKAPKLHSYKTTSSDLGDYYERHGLSRTIIGGKVTVVDRKAGQ